MADAGHNLSDVVGLVIAWIASALSKQAPSTRYTYGLGGSSILAALFNAVLLLVAVGAIGWEAVLRLFHPEPVASGTIMIVPGLPLEIVIVLLPIPKPLGVQGSAMVSTTSQPRPFSTLPV